MSDTENTEKQNEQSDDKQSDDKQQQDDTAGLKSALKAERDARKANDKVIKDLQDKLAAIEGKDKSDVERLTGDLEKRTKEAEEAIKRAREIAGKASALELLSAANCRDSVLVYGSFKDKIEYDAEDKPLNLDALVAQAKKDHPIPFQATNGSGDGGRGGGHEPPKFASPTERLTYAYAQKADSR